MSKFIYVELSQANVSQNVLRSFDCKHSDFNDFLHNDALNFSADGNGVTYILVDEKEYQENNISVIFAFATIQTASLHYHENKTPKLCSISCAEIKYFAITRKLQNIDASSYIVPYTEDDPNEQCISMILNISSNMYNIFGIE